METYLEVDELFVDHKQVYTLKFRLYPDSRTKRQMEFYSAISRGEKPVYDASFLTRFKNWLHK